ncbi:MAG TPA: SpvB/TcaC N-terminal domain-containing protein, partial [Pilimelia sp.]|nr:SpvB/TcaC N-terminal domain-containing protein [Pilimelia sp.]
MLLRVRPQGGAGPVRLELDYSAFAGAYGGDWASRLRLVRLPACAATTPERPACRTATPVKSTNDVRAGTVSAVVALAAASPGPASGAGAPSDSAQLFALAAAPSGPTGDWSATPLSASATWQVSAQTGTFSWSYPLRVPPSVGGPAPSLALSYSSGSVDGRVASTNNQTSWIGDGWEMWPGYVERKYASCADDATSGANNVSHKTGDLCWKTDNATLSVNGTASELVKDAGTGKWRLKDDDGSRIERLHGGWNGDNDTEYWKLTTTDGTQYFFGREKRSAADPLNLGSAWTVPVFGNHSSDPCYHASFASAHCMQAWRWNLDYVVDPRGNTMTYVYAKETNRYGRNLNQATSAYDRGGYLVRVEYGQRAGTEASTTAPARVDFTVAERCLTNCSTLNGSTASNWPDVPADLICDSTSSCPDALSPAFFTRKRLTQVATKVWNGTGYDSVDSWTLVHTFPSPGDGYSKPVLWLNSIEHRGLRGGTVTLPTVTFTGVQLANRVDAAGDLGPAMHRYRISWIDTEAGARITVNYDARDCTPSNLPSAPHSNTRRCMPVYWTPEGYANPVLEYFHKYRVATVVADPDRYTGANDPADPMVVTTYAYGSTPAWHYDDNDLVPAKYRTWGEFRGYDSVDVLTGDPGSQSKVRYRYFRGMHGDHLPGGGTRQVTVDGINDHDRYAGFLREQITYNGTAGGVVTGTVNTPWLSSATATAADGAKAYLLGTETAETRTTAPALPGGLRRTRVVTVFDDLQDPNDDGYGLPVRVDDQGD